MENNNSLSDDMYEVFFKGNVEVLKNKIHLLAQNDIDYGLIIAASECSLDIVKVFIEHGANPLNGNKEALKQSISSGNMEVADYLNNIIENASKCIKRKII